MPASMPTLATEFCEIQPFDSTLLENQPQFHSAD